MTKYIYLKERGTGNVNLAQIDIDKISAILEDDWGATIYLDDGHVLNVKESMSYIMTYLEKNQVADVSNL